LLTKGVIVKCSQPGTRRRTGAYACSSCMARSARVVDARKQPEFVAQSTEPEMPGIVECIFPIEVVSYD